MKNCKRRLDREDKIQLVILLAIMAGLLIFLALSYAGDRWKQDQLDAGRPVATYSVVKLLRPCVDDSPVFVEHTNLGVSVVGLGQAATWNGQTVPTAWFRASDYPALDRCRWAAIEGELIAKATKGE